MFKLEILISKVRNNNKTSKVIFITNVTDINDN